MSIKDTDINDFYKKLLDLGNQQVDDKGRIYVELSKKTIMPTITTNGVSRELVLPTRDNLRGGADPEKDAFFHPLGENIQSGKSEVFDFLHRAVMVRLNTALTITGLGLLTLQTNPDLHAKFNKEQIDIMKEISESDTKSMMSWAQLCSHPIATMSDNLEKWNIAIFVKRKGTFEGKEYKRVGVVSFPAFEAIEKGDQYFKGESRDAKNLVRQSDYKMYPQVVKAIFPKVRELEPYNSKFDGSIAPFLSAFMLAVKNVATRINEVLTIMGPMFDAISFETDAARIPMDVFEFFEEENRDVLSDWLRHLPSLEGNTGRVELKDRRPPAPPSRENRRDEPLPWEDNTRGGRSSVPERETRRETQEPRNSYRDDRRDDTPANPYGIRKGLGSATDKGTFKDLEREEIERREAEEEAFLMERRRARAERDREEQEYLASRRRQRRELEQSVDSSYEQRLRYRDEPEPVEEPVRDKDGRLRFGAVLRKSPELAEGTSTFEELSERASSRGGRGYYGGGRRDERDDRGSRWDERDRRDERGWRDDGYGSRGGWGRDNRGDRERSSNLRRTAYGGY